MTTIGLALLVLLLVVTLMTLASVFSSLAMSKETIDYVPGVLLMQGVGGVWQYKWPFLVLAGIVQLPLVLHAILTRSRVVHDLFRGTTEVEYPDEAIFTALAYAFASFYLMQAALGPACLKALRGERPRFVEGVSRGVYRLIRLAPLAALVALLSALPVLACVYLADAMRAPVLIGLGLLLGLWYHSSLVFTVPVAYDAGVGPFEAMKRSFLLSAGGRYRLSLILLASAMVSMFVIAIPAHLVEQAFAHMPWLEPNLKIGAITAAAVLGTTIHATTIWVVYETILRERGESEPPIARVFA